MRSAISLILTDLDGTLVDTRAANYHAYRQVLAELDIRLTEEHYNQIFGLRLEEFLSTLSIVDRTTIEHVRKRKAVVYPEHFDKFILNRPLLGFLQGARRMGMPLAVVSTARRENIRNVLMRIEAAELFDLIVSGEDVMKSKPDPECYLFAMRHFGVEPDRTLVFEDTPIGIQAGLDAGANCISIDHAFYGL